MNKRVKKKAHIHSMNLGLSELLDSIRDVELLEIKIQKQSLSLTPGPQVGGAVPIDSPNLSLNQSLKRHTLMSYNNDKDNDVVESSSSNNNDDSASILNASSNSDDAKVTELRRNLRFQEILVPSTDDERAQGSARVKGSGATVIVFLRRFGCGVCRQVYEQRFLKERPTSITQFPNQSRLAALELSSIHDTLRKHDIRLVAIGCEELGYQEFVLNKFFHGELYIDTGLQAFSRLGLKKLGVKNGFGLLHQKGYQAMLAMAAGASSTLNFKGNFLQLGGVMIVNPDTDDLWLLHREQFAGDRPTLHLILQTLGFPQETLKFYTPSGNVTF